jgi:hypothetical protein
VRSRAELGAYWDGSIIGFILERECHDHPAARVAAQTVGQGPMKKRVKGRLVQYFMRRALD